MSNYLAIIPARGGSKRIPRKNITLLAGKPLISYTIRAALSACSLKRVIVSTDDEEISKVAETCGAEVPIMRPKAYAEDTSLIIDAIRHIVEYVDGQGSPVDAVVLLQPTSPFRTGKHINESIRVFEESGADTVTSVCAMQEHPHYAWTLESDTLIPFFPTEQFMMVRQDLPPAYIENGAIYITKRSLLETGTLYGDRVIPYVMSREDSVDIDTPEDMLWAEFIMAKRSSLNE